MDDPELKGIILRMGNCQGMKRRREDHYMRL